MHAICLYEQFFLYKKIEAVKLERAKSKSSGCEKQQQVYKFIGSRVNRMRFRCIIKGRVVWKFEISFHENKSTQLQAVVLGSYQGKSKSALYEKCVVVVFFDPF